MSGQFKTSRVENEADAELLRTTTLGAGVRVWNNVDKKLHMGDGSTPGGVVIGEGGSGDAATVEFKAATAAPVRTVQDKARDIVGAKDFGAKGDFAQDDRPGLQAAINNLGLLGGEIELSAGSRFLVSEGAGSACLTLTTPVSLVGKGGIYSSIAPASGVAGTARGINIVPTEVPSDFLRLQNLYIGNPYTGARAGGPGIRFGTTNTGITAGRILVEGCFTAEGTDVGFLQENNDVANVTGGMFCSEFRRNVWVNGMRFGAANGSNGTGDSFLFTSNTTTGAGIGVEFTGTIDADGNTPSQAVFINHNSTSGGGAFLFHRANFPTVQNANLEQKFASSGSFLIDFKGDAKPNNSTGVRAPSITNSLVSGFAGADLSAFVRFGSSSGGICFNNWFLDGGSAAVHDISISADAHDVWIGPNLSTIDDLRIADNGVGTRGVNKTLLPESSWIAPGNGEASAYTWKSIDGEVNVSGGLKNGSTSPGAPITVMPVGFRPAEIEHKQCACLDNDLWNTPAVVAFHPNGEVKIVFCPNAASSTQKIFFDAKFRAAHANTIKVRTPFVV